LMSMRSSRQLCALSRTLSGADEFFLALGGGADQH
jgi:hypothetical protein